jgi:hypothetical protein
LFREHVQTKRGKRKDKPISLMTVKSGCSNQKGVIQSETESGGKKYKTRVHRSFVLPLVMVKGITNISRLLSLEATCHPSLSHEQRPDGKQINLNPSDARERKNQPVQRKRETQIRSVSVR